MPQTYDQMFKQLLQDPRFFADFLTAFLPDDAVQLVLDDLTFLSPETFADFPHGERYLADLLVRVRTRSGAFRVILIHIEVQKERTADFPARLLRYHLLLTLHHDLPILPIALLLYPEGEGVQLAQVSRPVLGRAYLSLHYWQISLPVLEAQTYVQTASPLMAGLAAVMRRPQRGRAGKVALHQVCVERIAQALDTAEISETQAFLLGNPTE